MFAAPLISYLNRNKLIIALLNLAIMGYLLTYLFNVILSHYLTPIRFGEFNIALRVLTMLSSLVLLGTNMASRRFVSLFLRLNDLSHLKSYIKWNLNLVTVTFTFCLLLALMSYVIMHMFHIWHIKDIRTYHMSIYMLWITPIASILTLFESYLLCANYTILANFLFKIRTLFYMLFFLLTIALYDISAYSITLVIPLFLALICLFFVELCIIILKAPVIFKQMVQAITGKLVLKANEDWFPVSLRLTANNLLFLIISTADLLIVQFICPDKDAVGQYAVILTIASAIFVIPQNLYGNIKTKVSHLIKTAKGRRTLQNEIKQPNRYALMTMIFIGSCILYFSTPLLKHFGPVYLMAKTPLMIITLGFMVAGYAQAATSVIAYSGNEKLLLDISIIECALLLGLGILLTYLFGITGTAIATSLSMIFKAIVFHVESYQKFGIKTFYL